MLDMDSKEPFYYTRGPFWENKKSVPFWLLQVLTIFPLTGFFGIDHLFLRSPLTAWAKTLVNIFGLGIWYFYDILQVTIDKHVVPVSGLSVPLYGPTGIGAGVFREAGFPADEGAVSPWRFLFYCLLTWLPFGLDFFIAGDFLGGGLRFMTSALFFLWPLGFLWGCYNMYRAYATPGDLMVRGTYRIWPFGLFTNSYASVAGTLGPGKQGEDPVCRQKGIVESVMQPVNTVIGIATDTVVKPVQTALDGIASIPAAISGPLKTAMETTVVPTVQAGVVLGNQVPAAIAAVQALATNVENQLASAVLNASKMNNIIPTIPTVPIVPTVPTTASLIGKASTAVMTGGMLTNTNDFLFSDGALLFTLSILVFGGAFLCVLRSRNESTEENDAPPKPTTVRSSPATWKTNV